MSSILDEPWVPNPLLSDRSPNAVVIRKLRRQLAVYEGSTKLPFVPGSLGMTPVEVGIGTSVAPDGVTMADRLNALSSYLRGGGPNLLLYGFEYDSVQADIVRQETMDFERLTLDEKRAVQCEERRLVAELVGDRCKKGV